MMNEPQFTLQEIGANFGELLAQAMANTIVLKKDRDKLQADNAALSIELDRVRLELHQAQIDLIACQGNAPINEAKEKAAGQGG